MSVPPPSAVISSALFNGDVSANLFKNVILRNSLIYNDGQ